jgi:hypothetical protein
MYYYKSQGGTKRYKYIKNVIIDGRFVVLRLYFDLGMGELLV